MSEFTYALFVSFIFLLFAIWVIAGPNYEEVGAFITKHRKLVRKLIRAVAIIVGVAVYLNIGWAYGTYSALYLGEGMSQTTVLQKFLIGPNKILTAGLNPSLPAHQYVYMVFWSIWLVVTVVVWAIWLLGVVMGWMIWLVLWLVSGLWQSVRFVFRLVFAGGIAKLLGVG